MAAVNRTVMARPRQSGGLEKDSGRMNREKQHGKKKKKIKRKWNGGDELNGGGGWSREGMVEPFGGLGGDGVEVGVEEREGRNGGFGLGG